MIHRKLRELIFIRGIKLTVIAASLKITTRCLHNKITGRSQFTWHEVCVLQKAFFPDISKDELMETEVSG